MHKRNFLKLFAMVLSGTFTIPEAGHGRAAESLGKRRTLVIGAGLAGLAAARELRQHGQEVIVLEARSRIGGRIWTSVKWPDIPLDLGATWIHGVQGNPLTHLADRLDARRLVTRYAQAATYSTSGRLLSVAEEESLEKLRTAVFSALSSAQNRDPDTSVRQAVRSWATQTQALPEAAPLINFILSSEIEQEYAGSARQLSAHWYDSAQNFSGDDALFAQGFNVVTEYLSRAMQIELGQVVKEIHWGTSKVRVVTQTTEFIADRVIVTLPLGVLQGKGVRFIPELPRRKRNAIAKLGVGVLNKCYLRFTHAFWPHDVDWLEYISARPGEWTEWVSFKQAANWPVLLGFNAADFGLATEKWLDRQIVASAMQTLKTLFGRDIPDPIDYQITRWASDPFALGSYSFNALGSTPDMRNVLARPLKQKLYFAGEAASREYFGTAHGAYLSGLRAAREVLAT